MTRNRCNRLANSIDVVYSKLFRVEEGCGSFLLKRFTCMQHFGKVSELDTVPRPASQNIDPAKTKCRLLRLFTVAGKIMGC